MIVQPIKALLPTPAIIQWAELTGLLLEETLSRFYLHIPPLPTDTQMTPAINLSGNTDRVTAE